MKNSLRNLVNNLYTKEQLEKVKDVIFYNEKQLMNYSILAVAVEEHDVGLSKEEVIEFYNADETSAEWLTPVDYVIANLITTLTELTGESVKLGYDNSLQLGNDEPELEYLISVIRRLFDK